MEKIGKELFHSPTLRNKQLKEYDKLLPVHITPNFQNPIQNPSLNFIVVSQHIGVDCVFRLAALLCQGNIVIYHVDKFGL
jgi:hypothetical protein